jgi:4-hydroxy-L-threonine phosphate dehydrogenase PdxA
MSETVARAVELAMAGRVDAIVTGRLNKEALNLAGYHYAGHTDMLAALTNTRSSVMLLAHGDMQVGHVTTHVALSDVPKLLTPERLRRTIDLTHAAVQDLGIARPRVAVAALNPHAGEEGLFGRQDIEITTPVVGQRRADGMDVRRPRSGRHCSSRCARGSSMRWWRCITTRGTSQSSCWASTLIRRPGSGGRCPA